MDFCVSIKILGFCFRIPRQLAGEHRNRIDLSIKPKVTGCPGLDAIPVLTYAISLLLSCVMANRFRTARHVVSLVVVLLILQVPVVTGQSSKSGVTVSYEQSGTSRIARFKNSNSYHVRVEFSYQGTKTRGSGEASGQDAVFVAANFFATYGAQGLSITSVRIKNVMRSD